VPKRDSAPLGAPCWVDLFTSDPDTSKAFYGRLLGWTATDTGEEFGGYINFQKDGVPVAGAMLDMLENALQFFMLLWGASDGLARIAFTVSNAKMMAITLGVVMLLGAVLAQVMERQKKRLKSP